MSTHAAVTENAAPPFAEARQRHVVLRFGPFELDAARFELRRAGLPLAIAPQPFDLLWLLASRPGALVDREEIRLALWGTETFVTFDGCVNFCVRELRKTLGDDARSPRFIQAVRGRGYRFVARVERAEGDGEDASA